MRKSVNTGNKISTFGSLLPQRNFSSEKYRYGFGGMEMDNEVNSITGTIYTTSWRGYDSRLGRWFSVDPMTKALPSESPYNYANNTLLPQRNFSSEKYRFGFNGMEKDDEVKGIGNSLDFGARIYDSRVGRFLSVDPFISQFPSWSPYNFVLGNPILLTDPDGRAPDCPTCPSDAKYDVFRNSSINFKYNGDGSVSRVPSSTVKFSAYGKFKLTTGTIGAKFNIMGLPLEGSYDFGGAAQEIEIGISVSDKLVPDIEFKHTQTITEPDGHSLKIGAVGGSESSEKQTTTTFSLQDGFKINKENVFKKKESGSIGNVTGDNEGKQTGKIGVGAEIDALILGVGVEAGGKVTREEPK